MNPHYTSLVDSQIALALRRAKDVKHLGHPGLRGRAREIFLRDLLRPFLNPNLSTCTGVLVDSEGRQSNQIDIIVYDKNLLPPILLTPEEGIVPCESALATIEIKSKLTAPELEKSVANARSVKALKPQFKEAKPMSNAKSSVLCAIFAYESSRKPGNESKALQRCATEANKGGAQTIHIPISACCIADSVFTWCSGHNPTNPVEKTFETVQSESRPLASFLSFLSDSTTLYAAQRSPMYSWHYFR